MSYYVYWLKKKITSYLLVWKRKMFSQKKKHNYLPRPSYQKVRIPSRFLNKANGQNGGKTVGQIGMLHRVEYLLSAISVVLVAIIPETETLSRKSRLNQSSMTTFMFNQKKTSNAKKEQLDKLVTLMICKDNLPLTILQREGFRNLMAAAVPDYKLPCYERMRDTLIHNLHEEVAAAVKKRLASSPACSVMMDFWSSNAMEGFLGVSCSAVTCDYVPFTAFLALREMPKNHTAAAVFAEYESVIEDWEINKKVNVIRCVTENARNMVAALRLQLPTFVNETEDELVEIEIEAGINVPNYLLIPEFVEFIGEADNDDGENNPLGFEDHFAFDLDFDTLLNDKSWKYNETGYNITASYHARCLPHHIQLAIKDGLLVLEKVAKDSLNLLGKIVGGIRRSVVDTKTLMDCVGFKIPMLNQTRWSSQYGMIKGTLEAIEKDPSIQSKLNSCTVHGSLTAIQIKCLRELIILLGPFKLATDAFQKEHETIGLVTPFYLDLVNKCSLDSEVNPDARSIISCKTVVEALQNSLKARLSYVLNDSLYLIGSILDPRIKTSFIKAGGLDEKAVLKAVSDVILSRYGIACERESESSANEKRQNSLDFQETSAAAKRSKFNRPMLSSVLPQSQPQSHGAREKVLEEFQNYLAEPVIVNDSGEFDLSYSPLLFWKLNEHRFPVLSLIARDVMGVPASSSNIERGFSTAVDIKSAKRNGIKAGLFQMLLFIKKNCHFLS
ncbi:Uncharacterized protein APZ42_028993 [Daphnia magna]|uniref:HAT C-terminal dimerisation domain-containing protein n=1 Tax=Daphnia magna TaxID=35525 RepID=A0A164Q005_9CRUS|nr:Uncharacterized protein APZ42_028993 [Daphnia magna]